MPCPVRKSTPPAREEHRRAGPRRARGRSARSSGTDGPLPLSRCAHRGRATEADRRHRNRARRCLHPLAAEAGPLRFRPVQRLRILRSQIDELTDDAFHAELADIVTRLRDAHTRYVGPSKLAGQVAVLPFLVEMAGTPSSPTYVVTHVAPGLDQRLQGRRHPRLLERRADRPRGSTGQRARSRRPAGHPARVGDPEPDDARPPIWPAAR